MTSALDLKDEKTRPYYHFSRVFTARVRPAILRRRALFQYYARFVGFSFRMFSHE
jgi:hypothetical protein